MTRQEIEHNFDLMVTEHNHSYWEVEDSGAKDQCFDLALGWCDYLRIPRQTIRHDVASQIWTQIQDITLTYFEVIPNTPYGVPQKGDIVVFSGPTGHVSVAEGVGDSNGFTSFDQNFPIGSICHFQNHDYKSILGWLRPKSAEIAQPVTQITDDQKRSLDSLSNHFLISTDLKGAKFGNLEGYTNVLTQDAYNAWKNPPQLPINQVSDSVWDSLKKFFGRNDSSNIR